MDQERFEEVRKKIIGSERVRTGIGTLQEKTLHAVCKHYYGPDEASHEILIHGYVADIYTGTEIIEIQNGNFNKMRDKLEVFLADYQVTLVYPIPHTKWLIWVDEETGALSKKRKSPVTGTAYRAFSELYRIKRFLGRENLRLRFPLIDIEEYRLLNGWSKDRKKGSVRYDRIPVALFDEVVIECLEDYLLFLPYDMPEVFTSADLGKAAGIRKQTAGIVLNILLDLGIVERTGKKGRFYQYHIREAYR